jgi:hypothetical protein
MDYGAMNRLYRVCGVGETLRTPNPQRGLMSAFEELREVKLNNYQLSIINYQLPSR